MKKKVVFLVIAVLITSFGAAFGFDYEKGVHGEVEITYQSKYVWRGFDIFEDNSAFQPSVTLDLFGSGFGVNVMGHRANKSGYELNERWDYMLFYRNCMFMDERYETQYHLGFVYYNYPQLSAQVADLMEAHMLLSWPQVMQVDNLVPRYCLVKLWPANSNSAVGAAAQGNGKSTASGWAHIFMMDYAMPIQGLTEDTPQQMLNLHSELVYNDGIHPAGGLQTTGGLVDHDWSNAVFGISTDFDLGDNMMVTPGVFYQHTLDDSVNEDKDETWATVSMKYKF